MKKLLFSFLFLLLGFFVIFPQQTFAHFPKTDGNVTVTLHVDPDDDPIPGQQATMYFLIDKTITLDQCTCIVSVTEQGKQLFHQQLIDTKNTKPSIWGASLPFIFPNRDVYIITLTGNPKIANGFKPFTLTWYFRVDENPSVQTVKPHSDLPAIFSFIVAGVVVLSLLGIFIKKQILDAETVDNTKRKR